MSKSDGTFILVATYPDELAAQDDYQVVKEAHARGLVGSYDAAVITKDPSGKVHENKDETSTRHGAWWGIASRCRRRRAVPARDHRSRGRWRRDRRSHRPSG